MKNVLIAITSLVSLLLFPGCGTANAPPLFVLRRPADTGIQFANTLTEDDSVHNALDFDYMYDGGGVAVADFNNDGRLDLFFAGNMVTSRLYLNGGQLHFRDATSAAGLDNSAWVVGVTVIDINQDGRPDLYLSVAGPLPDRRGNLLFVNQGSDTHGTPRFVELAKSYGIADVGYNTHAVFFDYDRDGDLDLYVLKNALERFNRNITRPKVMHGEALSTDRLYQNNGNNTFTDVSRHAGITIEGYGLGVAVSDFNRDGWPDLYVANDFLSNDLFWVNNRDGTFTDQAARYLKHTSFNAMGVDVADFNNDGLVDIMVADMLPPDNLRRKTMYPGSNDETFHMGLSLGYQAQYVRNTLQLGNGARRDGTLSFSEIGQLAGVDATDWSWAPLFADLDNDGWKDLVVTNGYRRDVTNLDYVTSSEQGTYLGSKQERHKRLLDELRTLPEVKLANFGFHNNGDLTFSDRTKAWGLDVPSYSNGAVYADLDGDGDLEIVVNNIDGPASLFENRSEQLPHHNFLRFAIEGTPPNRDAYGAHVTLYANSQRQYLELNPSRGYLSTVEPFLHFGVGAATLVDSVRAQWPDGACQTLTRVATNQVVRLLRRNAARCASSAKAAPVARLFRPEAGGHGLDLRHVRREFPDFKGTPLLPHKFSEGGPGIAVGDVDGDGREDVYIGADRDQEKAIYLQTAAGHFSRHALPGGKEWQDMGALLFDADGDGDLDLLVTSGGAYLTTDATTYAARFYLNNGRGDFALASDALSEASTSASSVVASDYDGDGDLDLFIGGRVVPGSYPMPPRSYLLRNDTRRGGRVQFTDVTDASAPGLSHLGLVTSALFTDFDQDGQTDLLVVGEWMPLTFFRNQHGRFENVSSSTGLGETNGWWNGLVAGDFNHDGRTDYLIGNLGLNTRYRATASAPVRVHAFDFDDNGSIDPVLSSYVNGKSYAVASRDLLTDQMRSMTGRFRRYADYAKATLEQTLSQTERDRAYQAKSVNFASSYLENLGGGKFTMRPLPLAAQVAPIFGMLADDYDGDGNLDVLLVGNSYARDTQSGWDDASIGGLLLGDGRGGFRHLNGVESGFLVDGNAKAMASLMLDERRALVLVTQNDDSLRVWTTTRSGSSRNVKLETLDAYAMLTLADGTTQRQEIYYGSTYLSQSSRYLRLPTTTVAAVVHDSRGGRRSLPLAPPIATARRTH